MKNTMFGGCPGFEERAQFIASSGPVMGNPAGSWMLMGTP
jgi:hypothetical protein